MFILWAEIANLATRWGGNSLDAAVKTVEMILDFRRNPAPSSCLPSGHWRVFLPRLKVEAKCLSKKKKATKKNPPHIGGSMSCSYWRNSTCICQMWCTFTPLWLNPSSLIYPIEISTSPQHSIYVLYNIFLFFWNKLVLTVTTITLKPQKH